MDDPRPFIVCAGVPVLERLGWDCSPRKRINNDDALLYLTVNAKSELALRNKQSSDRLGKRLTLHVLQSGLDACVKWKLVVATHQQHL